MSDLSNSGPSVGLVGCGNWGRHILRDLVSLGCTVHVAARSEASRERAEEGGATSIVGSISDLPPVDAGVVAVVTVNHTEAVRELAAATAGPIFCEKPLTSDLASARALADDFSDRLFVMDKWRYHPGVLELARLAQSGELGTIQSIHSRRVSMGNNHPDVNTLWTHLPHDLAIGLEILGELPEPRFAVAEYSSKEIEGVVATLGGPPWLNIEVSNCAPGHRRETRVIGDRASAHLDGGWAEQVIVRDFDGYKDRVIDTPGELPLLAELRAFVEHIGGGPAPKSSAADAVLQVERIEQIIALAKESEGRG